MRIQDWPGSTRPYEKLINQGAQALSEAELLAIIIGTGYREVSALEVAQHLICRQQGLNFLYKLSVEELQEFTGIGRAKAVKLKAVAELSLRLRQVDQIQQPVIDNPQSAIAYLEPLIAKSEKEELLVLLLDVRKKLIRHERVSLGGLSSASIAPRDVFRPALKANAHSMILSHNHPSGDPSPSEADITATRELVRFGEKLGIPVVDHIIVGDPKSLSLRESGYY